MRPLEIAKPDFPCWIPRPTPVYTRSLFFDPANCIESSGSPLCPRQAQLAPRPDNLGPGNPVISMYSTTMSPALPAVWSGQTLVATQCHCRRAGFLGALSEHCERKSYYREMRPNKWPARRAGPPARCRSRGPNRSRRHSSCAGI